MMSNVVSFPRDFRPPVLRFERKFKFGVATIIRQEGRHERTVASAGMDRIGRS